MSEIHLLQGDCLEVMKTIPDSSVDAIITDPPYGLDFEYGEAYQDTREALERLTPAFVEQARRIAKVVVITCGVNNIYLHKDATWILSWYSPNSNGMSKWGFSCWQPIVVYGSDPFLKARMGARPDVIKFSELTKNDVDHPCPKPVNLMKAIIERCAFQAQTILDPFMGSGSTGVAAVQLGRNFTGIEINPDYFQIAERRITDAQMQQVMPL